MSASTTSAGPTSVDANSGVGAAAAAAPADVDAPSPAEPEPEAAAGFWGVSGMAPGRGVRANTRGPPSRDVARGHTTSIAAAVVRQRQTRMATARVTIAPPTRLALAPPRLPAVRPAVAASTARRLGRAARPSAGRWPRGPAPPAAAASDDVVGEMLTPSLANNPAVRTLAVVLGAAAAAGGVSALASHAAPAVHLLAWAAQFGTTVYVTFFAGIVMFKNMPRQAFGRVQAKLFPVYFSVLAAALTLQAAALAFTVGLARQQAITLGVGLAATLANLLAAEPAATRCMFERYDLENAAGGRDEDRISELKKQFGKLHGISSLFNLVALVACVAHGQWLAANLSLPAGSALVLG